MLTAEDKKAFINTQMEKYWEFCEACMKKYDSHYNPSTTSTTYPTYRAVPDSIQEYTNEFFLGFNALVKNL